MDKFIFFTLSIAMFLISSCTKSDRTPVQNQKKDSVVAFESEQIYVCTFHPLERSNRPGNCPICGAQLVSLTEYDKDMVRKNEEMKKKWKSHIGAAYTVIGLSVIKSSDCEQLLANSIKKEKGVLDFQIDIVNRHVAVFYEPHITNEDNIVKLISDSGFDANSTKATQEAKKQLPENCR